MMVASKTSPKLSEDRDTSSLEEVLQANFGFGTFRTGQRRVIEQLMEGKSAAAVFPTGGGKSLCYQLPALLLPGLTLVVSPLIALMKDQLDALRARGIAAARLDSSLTATEYANVVEQLRSRAVRLLYVAPERFNNERFRELLGQFSVSLFAVDEAHCISEWGHHFRPDYLKLAKYAQECRAERILALTATAPPKVLDDICREFAIHPDHATRTEFYRPNLKLLFVPTSDATEAGPGTDAGTGSKVASNSDKREEWPTVRDHLLSTRLQERPRGATIVYVTLQRTAERVATYLSSLGMESRCYHAGLPSEERTETQDWFIHHPEAIIVATIAFGMGIDKADIRYIYHYNLSKSIENYAQEIGRAGRDGGTAICETLLVQDDLQTLENFIYGDTPSATAIHAFVADIFSRGGESGLNLSQVSRQHDIRDLVVRTLLTYLELDGFLEGGTPYYNEYQFQPKMTSAAILERFSGPRRQFLVELFRQAKPARTWFHLDVDRAAAATKSDRNRVVRALDYLAEQQMLALRVAGVHHRYRLLKSPNIHDLSDELMERVLQRQDRELARLQKLFELMTLDGCQVSSLGEYFGEPLPQPCGHCSWCEQGRVPVQLRKTMHGAVVDERIWSDLWKLRAAHPQIFAEPRSLTRFACGIASPLLTQSRLCKHVLFGVLDHVPFAEVLDRCHEASRKQT